jgi:hypothetical protein
MSIITDIVIGVINLAYIVLDLQNFNVYNVIIVTFYIVDNVIQIPVHLPHFLLYSQQNNVKIVLGDVQFVLPQQSVSNALEVFIYSIILA